MKTMKSIDGKRIFRVSDEIASQLYQNGEGYYVTKSEWKEEVRDVNKEPALNIDTGKLEMVTKSNKPSKAQKRQTRKTL